MFKYSRAAIKKTINDISVLAYAAALMTQSLMILYLVFSMIRGQGMLPMNIAMCSVTVFYLAVTVMTHGRTDKRSKRYKKISGRAYNYIKLSLTAFNLITLIYSVYVSSLDAVTPFTLVVLPLMIIMWVLQVAIEFLKIYLSRLINLLIDGVEMDLEPVLAPAAKITNAVKGVFGEAPENASKVSDKNRIILEEIVEETEENKKTAKAEKIRKAKEYLKKRLFIHRGKKKEKSREMSASKR